MAQTKSSASGTSTAAPKMTAAELRQKYGELENRLRSFEDASEAVRQLRDVSKNQTKNVSVFSKTELRGFLENIGSSETNLRNLSWYLYYRCRAYSRVVNFYANMFCLNARSIIPDYDFLKTPNDNAILKTYQNTIDTLDNMRVQDELYNAFVTCFIQDVFYGIVFYDETGIFIYNWPADYARINGKYMTGDFSFAIDCSYFRRYQELIEWFPEPFKTLYDEYQRTGDRWQTVPDEYALCLKFRREEFNIVAPPFVDSFNAFINLADLEDIQAIADEQSIYKMLWLELETISGSKNVDDWKINPQLAAQYFNKMVDSLPPYISAAFVPGKLNEISFPDDQATDTSKIAKATETVLNTTGGAEVLNGATINNTYAFKMAAIQNTEYAISSLLPQVQSWVNRFVEYTVPKHAKVKFFPVSVYTIDDFRENLLTMGQNGLPTKLALATLSGFSEKDVMALNHLEEDILKLSELFKPLSTSYTQSNDGYTSEVGQGAPEKDAGDLSDSGERSRNR